MPQRSGPVIFIGPSGAGKSTLADELVRRYPQYQLIKSYTTRPKRDGIDSSHQFISEADFDIKLANNDFLGTQNVFGYRYGMPRPTDNAVAVFLLHAANVTTFRQAFKQVVVIEAYAPIDVLTERLRARGDQTRIDPEQLKAELDSGRELADLVIDTSQPIDTCLQEITSFLDKN
jgi:Guanylate kinase